MYLLLLMVVNMYKHMAKVVITILRGLTTYTPSANFLQCMCQKL